jgi:hypothetical protein
MTIKALTPKELATTMGLSPKRLRQILRAEYPRQEKGKDWEIPLDVAKKIEKAYKAKVKARAQKHSAKTTKVLEGS